MLYCITAIDLYRAIQYRKKRKSYYMIYFDLTTNGIYIPNTDPSTNATARATSAAQIGSVGGAPAATWKGTEGGRTLT